MGFCSGMATAQLTASSVSVRSLGSFEGLRPISTVRVSSFSSLSLRKGGLSLRSTRGLVVKAATTVAPKVLSCLYLSPVLSCLYLSPKVYVFLHFDGNFYLHELLIEMLV